MATAGRHAALHMRNSTGKEAVQAMRENAAARRGRAAARKSLRSLFRVGKAASSFRRRGATGAALAMTENPMRRSRGGAGGSPMPLEAELAAAPMQSNPLHRRKHGAGPGGPGEGGAMESKAQPAGRSRLMQGAASRRRRLSQDDLTNISAKGLKSLKNNMDMDNSLRKKNLRYGTWSIVCLILMIVDEEQRWDYGPQYEQGLHNLADTVSFSKMDIVIPVCNLIGVYFLIDIYTVFAQQKMERWLLPDRWSAFWQTSLRRNFVLELLIALLQPLPWKVYQYKFAGDSWIRFLGLLMFMRCYTLGRIFRDHSIVYRNRHSAKQEGYDTEHSVNFMVTLRAELKGHPGRSLGTIIVVILIAFSYIMYVLEREARYEAKDPDSPPTIETPNEALWFVVATLTTAGYGDKYPSTSKGYYPAIAEGIVGMVVTSLLVAVVIDKTSLTESDRNLYNWVEAERARAALREAAASLIGLFARHYLHNRDHLQFSAQGKPLKIMRASGRDAKGRTLIQATKRSVKTMRYHLLQQERARTIGIHASDSDAQIVVGLLKRQRASMLKLKKLAQLVEALHLQLARGSAGRAPPADPPPKEGSRAVVPASAIRAAMRI